MSHSDTFLTYRDILTEVAGRCIQAADDAQLPDANAPGLSFLNAERELGHGLLDFVRHGNERLLDMQIQFKPEPMPEPHQAAQDSLRYILAVNQQIDLLLDALGKKAEPQVQEDMQELRAKVDNVSRKMALMKLTDQDL